jgi:predicted nucleic-acid-binding protein
MKIAIDTNILVRALVYDDPEQAAAAEKLLTSNEAVCIGNSNLCELAWVLSRRYKFNDEQIGAAFRALLNSGNVEMDRAAVEFGLSVLAEGGDFGDGVIAHEGIAMGGETFVSFDKKAVGVLTLHGVRTQLL